MTGSLLSQLTFSNHCVPRASSRRPPTVIPAPQPSFRRRPQSRKPTPPTGHPPARPPTVIAAEAGTQETQARHQAGHNDRPFTAAAPHRVAGTTLASGSAPSWIAASAAMTGSLLSQLTFSNHCVPRASSRRPRFSSFRRRPEPRKPTPGTRPPNRRSGGGRNPGNPGQAPGRP